ncbi:MAG: DUF3899 domain-containing protein [Bacillota bacterium]|nr:MAG: DUF3899 domain-containing protein [Bacillota bacterium]
MKQIKDRKIFKYMFSGVIIGMIVFGGTLLYSQNFTLEGLVDGATMSAIILFVLGWFLYISNEGSLDILVYGVQAFGKALVGKRMKDSYYDYTTNKERVSKDVYLGFWLSAAVYIILFAVLYIIYKN